MAIAFRTESHVTPGIGANADPLEPTGAASGDVLIALLVWDTSVAGSGALPTGWIGLYDSGVVGASTNQFRCLVGYIVRGGSAVATAFTNPSSYREANILAFTGVDNTTPIDSQSASGTTGTTGQAFINPPATTAVSSTTLAVSGGVNWAGSSSVWTASTGYTIRSNNAAGNDAIVQTKTLGASGSEDPANITGAATSSASFWNGFTITLAPAGAGGTSSAWQRGTGPRQLTGPYSRQRQFGVDAVTSITTPLTIAVTGSSTVTTVRGVQKVVAVTAAPTIAVVRAVTKGITTAGTGAVGVLRSVGKTIAVTGSSAVSVTVTKVKLVALAVTGSSTVTVLRQVGKITATTGTGIVSVVRSVRLARSVTGTGTASVARAVALRSAVIGSGIVSVVRRVALRASATGSSIVSVSRNVFTGGTQFPVSIAVTAASTVKVVRVAGITTRAAGTAVVAVARRAAVAAQVIGSATVATLRRLPITVRTTGTAAVAIRRSMALAARLTGAFTIVVRVVGGAAQALVRGWSTTGTTSPSSSTTQADTTTTSKATVTIL